MRAGIPVQKSDQAPTASSSRRSAVAGTRKARGSGSYATACDRCKEKKLKCTKCKPCTPCVDALYECTSDGTAPRRTITPKDLALVETRKEALQGLVGHLSSQLEKYKQRYGPLEDAQVELGQEMSSFIERHTPPQGQGEDAGQNGSYEDHRGVKVEIDDEDEDLLQHLTEKRERLVYDHDDLFFYGKGTAFELAPRVTAPPNSRFPDIDDNFNDSYTLLVGNYDLEAYNPELDFSRYLCQTTLDRFSHDHILDMLFKFFMSWCFRIVPALFLRDMYRAISLPPTPYPRRTAHYSPMLHNALIAVGAAFSDKAEYRTVDFRTLFLDEAKRHLDTECQRPSLSAVHALSTLASFYSSQGEQTLGYMYSGMAARLSQALGLSFDCSPWAKANIITYDDRRDRNWAYWTIFAQDICWSLYVGRETCMPLPPHNGGVPFPFIDSEFDQAEWKYPPIPTAVSGNSNIGTGAPSQPNHMSRTFVELCCLLMVAKRIMEFGNRSRCQGAEAENALITEIDEQLKNWFDTLPPELSMKSMALPHIIMLHLTYRWLFIILHRPFYPVRRDASQARRILQHFEICDDAAKEVISIVQTYRKLYTLLYVPVTFVQIVFSTGTVFILSVLRADSGIRRAAIPYAESLRASELCIDFLEEVGRTLQCGKNAAGILRSILKRQIYRRLTSSVEGGKRPIFAVEEALSSSNRDSNNSADSAGSKAMIDVVEVGPSSVHIAPLASSGETSESLFSGWPVGTPSVPSIVNTAKPDSTSVDFGLAEFLPQQSQYFQFPMDLFMAAISTTPNIAAHGSASFDVGPSYNLIFPSSYTTAPEQSSSLSIDASQPHWQPGPGYIGTEPSSDPALTTLNFDFLSSSSLDAGVSSLGADDFRPGDALLDAMVLDHLAYGLPWSNMLR